MPRLLLALLALTLGGASSFLAACGDRNGLLPASKANAIIQDLNSVSNAVGSGDCATAERAVSRAKNVLHSATTSRHTLTDRLRLELDHLAGVATTQCRPTTSTTATTATTSSTPTSSTPTTSSQTTNTTPTTATTTPSTQTTDTSSTSTSTDTTTTPTDTGQTNGGAAPGGDGSGGHGHGGKGKGNGGGDSGGG